MVIDSWTIIQSYKDKRPVGKAGDWGPWLLVVYENELHYGRCSYRGPHPGDYEWELILAECMPNPHVDCIGMFEGSNAGRRYEVPLITAWREIPPLPEIPIKYKIRAGT